MQQIKIFFKLLLFTWLIFIVPNFASAMLSMELTRGVSGAIPIAVNNFVSDSGALPENIAEVIHNDLQNSGRFSVQTNGSVDAVISGSVHQLADGRYQVSFQLTDSWQNKSAAKHRVLINKKLIVSAKSLRSVAHHISDLVYQQLIGVRGIFSTRLAYIVVQRPEHGATHYILEVSDQDGYNPRPMLTSTDPIMSPAWSADARQIAYVSFEKQRAAIYIQDVATGHRHRVSAFPGINGAPAWSPDGKKLALVLSHTGSPNIFLMDLASHKLTPVTHDWSINTEPAFSPDGRSIIFTSNRGGSPQIYQKNLTSGVVNRITYNGNYNARSSMTADGRHLVVLNRTSGLFNIAILDLDNGVFRVLTDSSGTDNESPSVAPNGSMVLYGTLSHGRSVLAMASSDGAVQLHLPARDGEVQDPAWSPWLS